MGTRSVYAPLTIPYVIPIRDRPIGRIRHWKEDFENDKEGNQADSDDCNNRPFDSRHHAPPFLHHAEMPTFLLHRSNIRASRVQYTSPTVFPFGYPSAGRLSAFLSQSWLILKELTMRTLWPERCI